MEQKGVNEVVLRPKRQVTLPREVCKQLGIEPGDRLELVLDGHTLVAKPKKVVALEALSEIREAFKRSGITEDELQKVGRRIRQDLTGERDATKS